MILDVHVQLLNMLAYQRVNIMGYARIGQNEGCRQDLMGMPLVVWQPASFQFNCWIQRISSGPGAIVGFWYVNILAAWEENSYPHRKNPCISFYQLVGLNLREKLQETSMIFMGKSMVSGSDFHMKSQPLQVEQWNSRARSTRNASQTPRGRRWKASDTWAR